MQRRTEEAITKHKMKMAYKKRERKANEAHSQATTKPGYNSEKECARRLKAIANG